MRKRLLWDGSGPGGKSQMTHRCTPGGARGRDAGSSIDLFGLISHPPVTAVTHAIFLPFLLPSHRTSFLSPAHPSQFLPLERFSPPFNIQLKPDLLCDMSSNSHDRIHQFLTPCPMYPTHFASTSVTKLLTVDLKALIHLIKCFNILT